MKITIRCAAVLGVLVLMRAQSLYAADADNPSTADKAKWEFTADPRLPNVLLIGDSISIGYTLAVRQDLAGKANVYRPMRAKGVDNCGDTTMGLHSIDGWLGDRKWAVIHFNWGLWDLMYRDKLRKGDKVGGKLTTTPEAYEQHLEKLVTRLEATGATLIWANTTVVPEGEPGRKVGDDEKYNAVAARVMKKHGIATDDLFTLTKGFEGKYSLKPGNVHYTPEGYQRIASQVFSTIQGVLPK